MASPSIGCPSSSLTAHPSVAFSVHSWRRRHQQQQARRVVMAAAMRRYRGTVRKEAVLAELVERKVAEAMEACGDRGLDDEGCRVAWDEVEEVSQARAHFRRRIAEAPGDPLEAFCELNPTADDCAVVYVDD